MSANIRVFTFSEPRFVGLRRAAVKKGDPSPWAIMAIDMVEYSSVMGRG
jgi:hypothetical protein